MLDMPGWLESDMLPNAVAVAIDPLRSSAIDFLHCEASYSITSLV
jgi:hypothetical protein